MGMARTGDRGQKIDASGKLLTGETFTDVRELKGILRQNHVSEFYRCLSEKMLTYALGRGLEYYDKCAVDQVTRRLAKNHYKFSTLILEIVKSTPFEMRRGEEQQVTEARQ